eukprot:337038-Chlamydomonas_euryale.AAC.8
MCPTLTPVHPSHPPTPAHTANTMPMHVQNQARWSRLVGYVEQSDVHSPAQTVIEGLLFSARLRLPGTATDAQVWALCGRSV